MKSFEKRLQDGLSNSCVEVVTTRMFCGRGGPVTYIYTGNVPASGDDEWTEFLFQELVHIFQRFSFMSIFISTP